MPPLTTALKGNNNNSPIARPTVTRVACVGDSITELSGYPNHVQQLLGDSYVVGNFGACGTTVSFHSESPYMQSEAFIEAKDFQPSIAVVMLGTNDAYRNFEDHRDHFVADYMMLLEALNALASKPHVWVARPPHIFDEVWLSGRILSMEVIPAIDEAAKRANLPVIDVYSATDNPELFFDGVHPNDEGAKTIANMICQAII